MDIKTTAKDVDPESRLMAAVFLIRELHKRNQDLQKIISSAKTYLSEHDCYQCCSCNYFYYNLSECFHCGLEYCATCLSDCLLPLCTNDDCGKKYICKICNPLVDLKQCDTCVYKIYSEN